MGKIKRNDIIFDEQKRTRQKSSNINDPISNDMGSKNSLASKDQTY